MLEKRILLYTVLLNASSWFSLMQGGHVSLLHTFARTPHPTAATRLIVGEDKWGLLLTSIQNALAHYSESSVISCTTMPLIFLL